MKKLIAGILALCMMVSIMALGWGNVWLGATAETVEDTGGIAADAATATTEIATTTTTTENVVTTDTGATATETPAPEVTEPIVAPDSTEVAAVTDDSATATVEPEATIEVIAAEPTAAVEADVGSGPAWVVEGTHRRYGELDELLPIAIVNNQTVYLCSTGVIELSGYTVDELRTVSFGLDEGALGEEFCDGRTVIVSTISPSEKTKDNTVFIWVGYPSEVPSPEKVLGDTVEISTDESAQLETEIMVQAADYTADAACAPTFTLTAYPEMGEGMTFAVIVNEGDPQAIVGNTYAPTADGVYRFAVLDAEGTLKARSIEYSVTYRAPEATEEVTADASAEPTVEPTAEPEDMLLTQMDIVASVELAATETSVEEAAPELSVRAYNYVENSLSDQTPSFELSGAPDEGVYYYGISINGSAIYQMRDNLYAVTKSGDYTLTFYLLDADGNTVSQSGEYHVIVDYSDAEQNSEAWMSVGEVKLYGTLSSLLRQAESGSTLYLLTSGVIALTDTSKLASVNLAADPSTYGGDYGVVVSDNSPDGESAEGTTYVWVGVDVSDMQLALFSTLLVPTFTIDSVAIGSRTLSDGLWVNGSDGITFSVTDSVVGNTYTYEVSTDGGASFAPFSNGGSLGGLGLSSGSTYDIVFRLTGADDASNIVTAAFSLKYDSVAPVLICKAGTDNTLSFYAGDSTSGFGSDNNVTFNATASPISWSALLTYYGQNVYTYSAQYKGAGTIAAGTLAVRDIANNVAVWGKDIVINSGAGGGGSGSMSGGSASGGSAGGTTTSRTVYHAASAYTTVTAYNGVELAVENGTMNTLTIGDQQLDLSLKLDGATLTDGSEPSFKADFVDWKGGSGTETTDAESDDITVDTLVLTAADATLENGDYCWTFDGSVYKKLAASGIDYLVLNVGDNAAALSTAGFAAGIRYNMYRAAGLASKAFVYTIRMNANTGSVQIQVVVSGETYTLTSDQTSEFYYYDVYSGTMDMLNRPFGQEGVQGTAADGRQG